MAEEGDMQGDRGISNTVEVRGFSKKTSQELMEMYFENSRRSGGGDLKEVKIRDEVAYITFKEAEVAQKVASRSNHQVDGQTLTVTLFHPLPPKPCYQNRVLIQGLNNAITEELLRNFLETKTKAQVTEFLYGEEDGNIVVTFSDNIDIVQLGKIFQESSVEGVFLKVARVAISNCILVQNLHPSSSHDAILYYFENKRRSGGGDIERVEMETEERYCLIYFEDPNVIDRVLGQSHNVDGVDFEIHLHHECLGRRSSRKKSDLYFRMSSPGNKDSATLENTDNQAKDKTSSSVSSNPEKESDFVEVQEWQENDGNNCTLPLWIKYKRAPDMKIIKCMKNIPCSWNFHLFWNFYTKTEPGKQMLLEILNKYNCSVAVFAEDEDLFIFEMIEKIFEQESDVVQLIHVVLDNVHKCAQQFLYLDNILVDQRIQGDVLQVVRQRKELNIARFELMGQQNFDALCIICTEKDQTLVLDVVTEIIHMVKECFENHEETIHVEHKWQKVMRNFGYLQKLCEKYPNVTIISDKIEPAIKLKGPRDQSKPAADHFLQLLGTASSEVQEEIFSPGCQFEIFTYPEMCGYIDNIAMEHSIVWIPNHQTKKIHLFSKRSGGKKGVDKLIRGCVQERIYPLAKGRTVFSTKIIRSLEELKTMHTGKIFFSLSHKGLLLTASDDIFESIDDAVQEIICEETDLEKFVIILNGDDNICTSQGEEALKWRFIFDCPNTLKRLMESPVVKNANLVFKSGKSPCIRKENSVQNFGKEFEELLKCHADMVQIHKVVIPEEGVKLFLSTLNATDLFQRKLVFAYKVETTLFICGTKEYMGETIEQVNKIQEFVLNMNSHTSKIAVDDIAIKVVRKYINMFMLANTSKLRLELDEGAKVLAVTGLRNAVIKEKAKLEQMLQSITTRKCDPVTCISHLSFFEALEVAQYIEEILKTQNLVCSWETSDKDCCIVVTAFDKETCEKAVKMIDTACVLDSKTLKIDESTWIIPSDSRQDEAHSICTKLGGKVKIWLDMGKDEVVYVYTHDIKDEVKNEVEGLFDRWNRKKFLSVEKRVFDQLTVHGLQKLKQLETKYSVAIDASMKIEKMGFFITGKDVKIQSVLEELNSEGRIILKPSLKLSKQWFSSKDVEVILVPESEDSEIIILKDKSLLHCNQSNQAELRDKETNTEIIEIIPVFSLKISRPEDIKADLILPIDKSVRPLTFSCPHWNEGQSKDKHILSSVLRHLFEFISSVGGEAVLEIRDKKIGSWDVTKFIQLMFFAYKDQVETKLKKTRLFLLTKDEEIWNFVKGVVHDAYLEDKSLVKEPQMSRSRKGLVFNRIRVKVQKGQLHEAQAEVLVNTVDRSLDLKKGVISSSLLDKAGNGIQIELQQYQGKAGFGEILKTGVGTLPKPCMVIFHGVLYAYEGHSDSVKVQVLVNTVDKSLDLKKGVISSSLLDKAGNGIQRELKQYKDKVGFGEVLKTGVGTLPKPCIRIFHGVLYAYQGHSDSVKVFQDFLARCLEDANKKYRSIAFPPIGTGRLGYPKDLVASLLFQSVAKFEEAHPTSKLEEVIFVIYEKDQETLKVFEELYRRCVVSPVDPSPPSSSQGARPKTKVVTSPPPDQHKLPMKQEEQPVKDGTVSEGEDELTEAQCIENSEVTISEVLMKKIPKGTLAEIRKRCIAEIDCTTFSKMGQLENLHKFEGYLRSLNGKCKEEDSLSTSGDRKEKQECSSIIKRKAVDKVSEVKYKMFRFFFSDLCVSFLQNVGVHFSGDEGCIYVEGKSQKTVDEITDIITNAFSEMDKFQESDVIIKKDKQEHAKQLVVEMNSSSPEGKVYCYLDDLFNIHIIARAMEEVQAAKHKINLKLGDIKIISCQKKLFSTLNDNDDNKQASSSSTRSSLPDNTRRSFMTAEGIKVFVYNCSILRAPVDVIVNAANEDLKHTDGVAKVIADAAGRELIRESQKYIRENSNLTVGASCITQGGNLRYAFVIHTVGPEWSKYSKTSEGLQQCMQDLWKAVIGCFFKAETLEVQSIALPAVSSGIYGVPMEVCAGQYLSAVLKYSKSTQGNGSLKEIHFIDVNKESLDLIELVFSASLENNKAAAEEFDKRLQSVLSRFGCYSNPQTLKSISSLKKTAHSSENFEPHYVLEKQKTKFHFSKVFKVLIYTGNITDSTCQAIVSSEDKDLKSQGGVAKAIMIKAGQTFDKNLASKRGRHLQVGDVIELDGAKLKCKVICCIIPKLSNRMSDEDYKKQLGQCFRNILEKVKTYKSVAIPLFGTGGKNNNFEIYGRVLLHCLLQFSNALRQKEALMEVHIVSLDEEPIVCVTSIFTEYFDSEKRLDSESTKAAYKGGSSTTSSNEQGHPPQNSSLESRNARQGSISGEHNKARVEADMDIIENLASSNTGSNQPPESQKITRGDDSHDNCAICLDTFNDPVKMKKCGHLFCKGCIDTQLQYKPVCPACGTTYGIITGNQPKGTMTERVDKYAYLEGYEGCGVIQITYNMPAGVQGDEHPKPGHHYYGLYRNAYLPNNEKGQKVLHLLHLAFDRRLIFTIGQSVTSGKEDMVTWNDIHHKTSMFGGPQKNGYPDPTYLDRVLEELAAKGVTEESERQDPEIFSAYERVPH